MNDTTPWRARFDDRGVTGRSWELVGQLDAGATTRLDAVAAELRRAERAARAGAWVALVVAYEAAGAFDPALAGVATPAPGQPLVAWAAFEARRFVPPLDPPAPAPVPSVTRRPASGYPRAVDAVRERIAAGDVYQVNVTDRFGQVGAELEDVYGRLLGSQSASFGARLHCGDWGVACASPELFFEWDGDTITCRPMKGTRARHPRADVDATRAAELAASAKDRAENVMIVDLLRNDLSRLARPGSVRVPELFTIERYETVWQMTSTVQADVDPATSLVDVFRALFPCGSVTGAPKIAAMRIIDELEHEPRGVYCGAVGYLAPPGAGPRAVCCVPIRTAVVDTEHRLTYGAGAGITWSSDPAEEDAEVLAKARVLTHPWTDFELLETLRLDHGGVLHPAEHLDRVERSAAWFGIPFDRAAARALLDALARPARPVRVRLLVRRDGTARVETASLEDSPDVVRLAIDTAITRSDDVFSCHKTTARAHYAAARARHPDADDVVMVNEHGHAVETTVANLAYRIGDAWYVPPLTDGGLPGIGRAAALDAGRVRERSVAALDLRTCDELAVLNDLRGWRPATLLP